MGELISVIVPVYKVEKYLRKCIESIINQTYTNLEIILVEDGSPDNCGAICDEYAKQDKRIVVIHKRNGGLSDARNAGLDIMHGDYVAFVDSDDWIEPRMYEVLKKLMDSYQTELAVGGVVDEWIIDDKVVTKKVSDYGKTPFAENSVEAMKRYFHGAWAAWDKLYKAELFRDVRYPVGEINEDEAIVLRLLHQCKKVCYTNEVFYHYIKRNAGTSITTSEFSVQKLDWKDHCKANLEFVCNFYPELKNDAIIRYRSSLLWSLTEIALSNKCFDMEINQLINEIKIHKNEMYKVKFKYLQDKVRMWMILNLPFDFYRKIIRLKRRGL